MEGVSDSKYACASSGSGRQCSWLTSNNLDFYFPLCLSNWAAVDDRSIVIPEPPLAQPKKRKERERHHQSLTQSTISIAKCVIHAQIYSYFQTDSPSPPEAPEPSDDTVCVLHPRPLRFHCHPQILATARGHFVPTCLWSC